MSGRKAYPKKARKDHRLPGTPGSSLRQRGSCMRFWSQCFVSLCQHGLNIYSACMSPLQCPWHLCKPQHTGDSRMLWLTDSFSAKQAAFLQVQLPGLEACSADHSWTLDTWCFRNSCSFLGHFSRAPQTPGCCGCCWIPPHSPKRRLPTLVRGITGFWGSHCQCDKVCRISISFSNFIFYSKNLALKPLVSVPCMLVQAHPCCPAPPTPAVPWLSSRSLPPLVVRPASLPCQLSGLIARSLFPPHQLPICFSAIAQIPFDLIPNHWLQREPAHRLFLGAGPSLPPAPRLPVMFACGAYCCILNFSFPRVGSCNAVGTVAFILKSTHIAVFFGGLLILLKSRLRLGLFWRASRTHSTLQDWTFPS